MLTDEQVALIEAQSKSLARAARERGFPRTDGGVSLADYDSQAHHAATVNIPTLVAEVKRLRELTDGR